MASYTGSFVNGSSPPSTHNDEEHVSSISSTKNSEKKNSPEGRFGIKLCDESGAVSNDETIDDLFG